MFRSSVKRCSYQDDLQEEEFVLVQDVFFGSSPDILWKLRERLWNLKQSSVMLIFLPFLSFMSPYELRKYQLYTSRSFTKPSLKRKEKRIRPHLCSFMTLLPIFYVAAVELRLWFQSVIPT